MRVQLAAVLALPLAAAACASTSTAGAPSPRGHAALQDDREVLASAQFSRRRACEFEPSLGSHIAEWSCRELTPEEQARARGENPTRALQKPTSLLKTTDTTLGSRVQRP